MTTLSKTFSSEAAARRRVEALRAAGVPARDVLLITGSKLHDVRREPVGEFALTAEPEAPVGTFANRARLRGQGCGAFAGDPDAQRQGSFADTDTEAIVSFENGAAHSHPTSRGAVRRLLHQFALEPEAAEGALHDLERGRAVVLAQIADIASAEAEARLKEPPHAA